ncbi:hypothetical protein YC2023_019985 [Brassica napus]
MLRHSINIYTHCLEAFSLPLLSVADPKKLFVGSKKFQGVSEGIRTRYLWVQSQSSGFLSVRFVIVSDEFPIEKVSPKTTTFCWEVVGYMITGQSNHSKKSIYYICNLQERIGQNIILYLQMTSSGLNQTRIISQWTDGPLEKEGKGCSVRL